MSKHFNGLSPAEAERLAYLIEEASEVIHAASKVLRHGYASYNPDDPDAGNNRRQLTSEMIDLAGAIARMEVAGDLSEDVSKAATPHKGARYMHHQGGR